MVAEMTNTSNCMDAYLELDRDYYTIVLDNVLSYIRLWSNRIAPPISILLSLPVDLLLVLIFAIHGCGVNYKVKFYYILVGVMEALVLVSFNLFEYVAFQFRPADNVLLPFNTSWFCKLVRWFWYSGYQGATFAITCFSLERLVIVKYPIKAKVTNFSQKMLTVTSVAMLCTFLYYICMIFGYNVVSISNPPYKVCILNSSIVNDLSSYSIIWQCVLPMLTEFLCNLWLYKLLVQRKVWRNRSVDSVDHGVRRSDLSVAVTLVTVGFLHASVSLVVSISWLGSAISQAAAKDHFGAKTREFWFHATTTCCLWDFTLLVLCDFAVYCMRMKDFRNAVLRSLSFRWLNQLF